MLVAASPDQAEQTLLAGQLACPTCQGVLRPHGWARRRTIRGPGARRLVVTPRRARCPSCARTHVVLPAELVPRRADSAEVIGQALVDKALGAGWRTIAERTGHSPSTVRRWLRAARATDVDWLFQRGIQTAIQLDPAMVHAWKQPRDPLVAALDILLRAAETYRRLLNPYPLWALVNAIVGGRLLAPQRR